MKNLLILCGGQSPEHKISLRSTKNILKALDHSKYQITLIGITKDGSWRLLHKEELGEEIVDQGEGVSIIPGQNDSLWIAGKSLGTFDVAFPVLHGPNGEDGTIQGLFRLLKIPFVGPGVLGSAASMDKDVTKRLLRDAGINVANWQLLLKGDEVPTYEQISSSLGQVLFVKPANMGSSVGVHRVSNANEWNVAIEDAFKYDRKVLVEANVTGRELECAVLGNDQTPSQRSRGSALWQFLFVRREVRCFI